MSEYVLGVNPQELERLQFQQHVWGELTDAFLRRLPLRDGARCLDAGCGPGLVIPSLCAAAGPNGSVVAVDESPVWIEHVRGEIARAGRSNVEARVARLEELDPGPSGFDLIYLRWVLSFPPNPAEIVRRLARCLAPGGILALQDYNHEGISVFPESPGFRAVVQGTRRLYASRGGDPWVAARLPKFFADAGLAMMEFRPNVLAGGPGSGVFRWADLFFVPHSARMVEAGVLTPEEQRAFVSEWNERRADPNALFFSPIVVDAAARRIDG